MVELNPKSQQNFIKCKQTKHITKREVTKQNKKARLTGMLFIEKHT